MTSLDQPTQIAIVRDPVDTVARQGPVAWAVERLREALAVRGEVVRLHERVEEAAEGAFHVLVAGGDSPAAAGALGRANARLPQAAEALALIPLDVEGRQGSVAVGRDALGLVYAVLELTDRVRYGEDVVAGLRLEQPVVEQPANAIRSVMRLFSSDVEDTGWFHDRTFWRRYLDELATQRFNRVNLSLGLGYDFPRAVRDAYLYFSYPFLLSVPGYDVRVRGLAEGEQDGTCQ